MLFVSPLVLSLAQAATSVVGCVRVDEELVRALIDDPTVTAARVEGGPKALAQALDPRSGTHAALADCALLSLGTGTSLVHIRGQRLDWGYAQWAKPLIGLMMDGTAGIADYQCARMLGARYHRLAPAFAPGVSIPLDAVDRIPKLREFAAAIDLSGTVEWIETEWLGR